MKEREFSQRRNEDQRQQPTPPPAPDKGGSETRSWSIPAIGILAIITGVAIAIALLNGSNSGTSGEQGSAEPTPILQVTDFDPLGDGNERQELKSNAIDSEPTSYWETEPYRGPDFGNGLKQGVGLLLEIDEQEIKSVEIDSATTGWSMEIYVGNSFGDVPSEWGDPTASITSASGTFTETFEDGKPKGSRVLLWITDHGSTDGRYLFRLNEVTISK